MMSKRALFIFLAISAGVFLLSGVHPVSADEQEDNQLEAPVLEEPSAQEEHQEPATTPEDEQTNAPDEPEVHQENETQAVDAETTETVSSGEADLETITAVFFDDDVPNENVTEASTTASSKEEKTDEDKDKETNPEESGKKTTGQTKRYVEFPGIRRRPCGSDYNCPRGHVCRPAYTRGPRGQMEKLCVPGQGGSIVYPDPMPFPDSVGDPTALALMALLMQQPADPVYPSDQSDMEVMVLMMLVFQGDQEEEVLTAPHPFSHLGRNIPGMPNPFPSPYPGPHPYPYPGPHHYPYPEPNPYPYPGPIPRPYPFPSPDNEDKELLVLLLMVFHDEDSSPFGVDMRGGEEQSREMAVSLLGFSVLGMEPSHQVYSEPESEPLQVSRPVRLGRPRPQRPVLRPQLPVPEY